MVFGRADGIPEPVAADAAVHGCGGARGASVHGEPPGRAAGVDLPVQNRAAAHCPAGAAGSGARGDRSAFRRCGDRDLGGPRRDPSGSPKRRDAQAAAAAVASDIDALVSMDTDRVLRAFAELIQATLRTNYFVTQEGSARSQNVLSLKLDAQLIEELPLPRPKFEIFVYSPRVEGVHLRFGYVARGGLRWSDRREDFRTEVLGLMKAQNVKNTLIVPVGAKGGFVPKRLPAAGTREEIQAEVVSCYQTFIRGLLDLTDNIVSG